MGKYGSGTKMRTVILDKEKAIVGALERNGVRELDRKIILDAFKEMAYQWCSTNATACAFEEMVKEKSPETWQEMMAGFLHDQTYNETFMSKMKATWPY